MLMRKGFVGLLIVLGFLLPSSVSADQPQDWLLSGSQEEGDYLTVDLLIGAAQANYSKEIKIFGNANQLTLRGGGLLALPFARVAAGGDLRILILSLGMDVGYQSIWRGLQCTDEECTRKERRTLESGGEFTKSNGFFWEGRGQLALPFNDYFLGLVQGSYLITDTPDNYYDYQNGVMRDSDLFSMNYLLFFRHKDFGGFAPMIQQQHYTLQGKGINQYNFGFTFVTRAGLVRDNDLLVVRALFNNPDWLGGTDLQDSYGQHVLRGPMQLLLAYRSVIEL